MKPFKNYDKTQAYSESKQLPKGAYILKIMGTSIGKWPSGDEYVKISCDIAEGEFTGFYEQRYRSNTSEDKKWGCNFNLAIPNDDETDQNVWAQRRFKTFTTDLEDSNDGYHFDWDESKFKGKLIGGLFNTKEFESNGRIVSFTNLARFTSVERVRSGNYKLPPDQLVERKDEGFQNVGQVFASNEPLPFD